jgi:hypothetical protein
MLSRFDRLETTRTALASDSKFNDDVSLSPPLPTGNFGNLTANKIYRQRGLFRASAGHSIVSIWILNPLLRVLEDIADAIMDGKPLPFGHPPIERHYLGPLAVFASPVVDCPLLPGMDIAQNGCSVWSAPIEQETPCLWPFDPVVTKKMHLFEEKKQTGIVPASVDTVHLSGTALSECTCARDALGSPSCRSYAAVEPCSCCRHSAAFGVSRSATRREQRSKLGKIARANANCGAVFASEAMAHHN